MLSIYRCLWPLMLAFAIAGQQGCASYHPLLTATQVDALKARDQHLQSSQEAIQARLREVKGGALVVSSANPPIVVAGDYPVQAAVRALSENPRLFDEPNAICIYVYQATAAVEPITFGCASLAAQARSYQEMRKSLDTADASLREQVAALAALNEAQAKHRVDMAELRRSLESHTKDIVALGVALGPTMTLSNFNNEQLKRVESSVVILKAAFEGASSTVAKNNEILGSTIELFAKTYNELKTRLDEIKQKLDTIK